MVQAKSDLTFQIYIRPLLADDATDPQDHYFVVLHENAKTTKGSFQFTKMTASLQ
jgi:hypothetical protein